MKLFALAVVIAALPTSLAFAENSTPSGPQSELRAQAKITETKARQIALSQVPKGTVKSIELENEKGLLIWSVDLALPDTRNITEVGIDAKTGAVVAVDIETPQDQEKEKAEDEANRNKSEKTK